MIVPPVPTIPTPTLKLPTPSFIDLHDSSSILTTLLAREGPECTDIFRCRTTTNIVLSCLTTIFACTWAALHLNVSEYSQSRWRSCWWKIRWMLVALIAPEIIAGKALADLVQAKKFKDLWNKNFAPLCTTVQIQILGKTTEQYEHELSRKEYDSHWTLTHGFLASMDGIQYSGGYSCTFKPARGTFSNPSMLPIIQQIGLISAKDIEDKSKGDWISKSFVVIQTTWFIVQCAARWASNLRVTELEVVTLASAALNIFIYALWWKKPQGLLVPYYFYPGQEQGVAEASTVAKNSEQEKLPLRPRSSNATFVDETPNTGILPKSETCYTGSHGQRAESIYEREWEEPTSLAFRGKFMGIHHEDVAFTGSSILIGTLFGGLHLIPIWLSVFPSQIEKILWKLAAFVVTAAPIISGISIALIGRSGGMMEHVSGILLFVVIATYAAARVILLVLAFTTLRSLCAEALLSVEWTRFIPHF